ncbi:aldo/keto reductase [Pseudonocardia spinosispora]|uniref:aldo/keto reductase n=1 Tax=Pseudonocardia spinosispora TaxID=103441 RepID=UPI000490C99F|nr:aldo/keto reductase [Pseudonocardia spinosispora]
MTHVGTTLLGDALTVSRLGYGAMGLSDTYGPADQDESLATLHHAVDRGVTLIDTADLYGFGGNEELVGRLLATRRDEVTLATKFGITVGEGGLAGMGTRGDAAYVREACEASLKRLGVEVIDLYYMHRRQVSVPIEETVGAMAELVEEGKVRHLGLSEVTADELRGAHRVHPIAAVQSEWSLWSRDVERAVVPTAAELGVGFVPYSPLGRGFLTGTLSDPSTFSGDWRGGLARFTGDAYERNRAAVATIAEIASALTVTSAQVALAWLRQHAVALGLAAVPIPGTRRAARVDENIASLDVTLDAEQVSRLDQVAEAVVGPRSDHSDPDWVSDTRE